MWTKEQLAEYTKKCILKYPTTPGAIVLKSFYAGNTETNKDWKFEHQRAFVETTIQIFNQTR